MITDELLRSIRNDLPMKVTILQLGKQGPPSKEFAGYFRVRHATKPMQHHRIAQASALSAEFDERVGKVQNLFVKIGPLLCNTL